MPIRSVLRCSPIFLVLLALRLGGAGARPREDPPGPAATARAVADALRALQTEVGELRAIVRAARAETAELRRELEAARAKLASAVDAPARAAGSAAAGAEAPTTAQRLARLEEEQELLNGKVDEHYQTKVESASKYRTRLSGIALLNLFGNRGSVDSIDLPTLARGGHDSGGSVGATLRQSEIGLEVFGPVLGGARTSAEIQLDLAGGFPETLEGVNGGLLRLRTATMRFDWPRASIVAGQDALFFSPLSPTSIASLAVPALSYSGNLWSWTPQVRVEHRVNSHRDSTFLLQAGLLDPLGGEAPQYQFLRTPQKSRQPAYAVRTAWTREAYGHVLTIAGGGYYSRQDWSLGRHLDSWVATSDWTVPLGSRFELSGELYRGRAIGGLGGSVGRSALSSGPLADAAVSVVPLDDVGGWTQLKFRPVERFEINGAFGQDSSFAREVRRFSTGRSYYNSSPLWNRSSLANFIYRPRSNLLFSLEYRRIRTVSIGGDDRANHVNLGIGVLF